MRIKSAPDTPARPYIIALVVATATFLAVLLLFWLGNQALGLWLGTPPCTPETFRDCAVTLAIVLFAVLQAPLVACAAVAWTLDRRYKKGRKSE